MGAEHKNTSLLFVCIMLAVVWLAGSSGGMSQDGASGYQTGYRGASAYQKDTLYLWYTDESLTDYINSAALAFYNDQDVRVVPVLQSGLQYVEALNAASVSGNEVPDLYLIGSDSLEKVIMAGLADRVEDGKGILSSSYFPQTALDAVTYQGSYYAYPFYYETAFLLYNETYLSEIADMALRMEIAEAQGDYSEDGDAEITMDAAIPEGYEEAQWEALVQQKMNELIPSSIEDILSLADSYDAPEKVENYFLWDVSDIFYNYFFAGAYMEIGGSCGDDAALIDIYNEDTIACMRVYQELHQFFSIESKESSYSNVIQEFLDGKSVFTIATSDALRSLESEQAEGGFPYEYGVAPLPGIDGEHQARGLAVTNVVVVNGYSSQKEMAELFASYLVYENANTLYDRTHKLQASYPIEDFVTDINDRVMEVYQNSASLPKIMEISNFWVQLELAYTKIWDGADVDDVLRQLSEQMKTQIAGEDVIEPILPADAPEL